MKDELRIIGDSDIAKKIATKSDIKILEDKITGLMDQIYDLSSKIEEKYIKKEDLPKIVEKTVIDTLRPLMKSK